MKRKFYIITVLFIVASGCGQKGKSALEFDIGHELYQQQKYVSAITSFSKAIELDPKNANSWEWRGSAKLMLKDKRGALSDYNKAIELEPNWKEAYYNRGLLKVEMGQTDSACLDFSKAGELGYFEAYEAITKYCK